MNFYQVNPAANDTLQTNLQNMEPILREIAITYDVLDKLLLSYAQSTDIPAINEYQANLRKQVTSAIYAADEIADASAKFSLLLEELNKEVSRI